MKVRNKWMLVVAVVVLGLGAGWWRWRFHSYTPADAVRDLQAAAKVQHAQHRVEKFLEARYGPLTDADNRQKALTDFFNTGHIEGLYLIVGYMPPDQKKRDIDAMAQWIANYRQSMTPAEKDSLADYFRSDAGRSTIQQATMCYLQKDARFRAASAPVIRELMTTVATTQQP